MKIKNLLLKTGSINYKIAKLTEIFLAKSIFLII